MKEDKMKSKKTMHKMPDGSMMSDEEMKQMMAEKKKKGMTQKGSADGRVYERK